MTISQDSSAPLIVVAGITGQQGGSVLAALKASSKPYRVVGITRDASKPSARKFQEQGVKMVSLTLSADNTDAVAKVLSGADYFFGVTNFWEHLSIDREVSEGKMMVDACKQAGVKTFLFSGLPSYIKLTNSKYTHVDHFEGKATIEEYAASQINFVSIQPAMYMSNFVGGMAPRKQEDGSFVFFTVQGFGEATLSILDTQNDYGIFVVSAIENSFSPGSILTAVGDSIQGKEVLKLLEKHSGKKINLVEVPHDAFVGALTKDMGPTVALEFAEMLEAHYEVGYYGGADTSKSLSGLQHKPATLDEYLSKQDLSKIFA